MKTEKAMNFGHGFVTSKANLLSCFEGSEKDYEQSGFWCKCVQQEDSYSAVISCNCFG